MITRQGCSMLRLNFKRMNALILIFEPERYDFSCKFSLMVRKVFPNSNAGFFCFLRVREAVSILKVC